MCGKPTLTRQDLPMSARVLIIYYDLRLAAMLLRYRDTR